MRTQSPLVLTSLALCVSWGIAQDAGSDTRRSVMVKTAIADGAVFEVVRERVASTRGEINLVPAKYVPPERVAPVPGNVAFLGIVHAADAKALAWVAYDIWHEHAGGDDLSASLSQAVWSAGAAWDPRRKRTLVALVRTAGVGVRVSLYEVDPARSLTVPDRLDGTDHTVWPTASTPTSTLDVNRGARRTGSVDRVVLVPEPTGVLLVLERSQVDDGPLYLRFTWQTRAWAWVRFVEEPE